MATWPRWALRMTIAGTLAAASAATLVAAVNAQAPVVRGRPEPLDENIVICFSEHAVQEFVRRYQQSPNHPLLLLAGCTRGKTGAEVVIDARLPGMKLSVRHIEPKSTGKEKCPHPQRPGYFFYCDTYFVIYGWMIGRMRESGRQDIPVYVRVPDSVGLVD
jgi:hypothetical protein